LPPVRIVIALAFVSVPQIALGKLARGTPLIDLAWFLPSILLVHLSYMAYVRLVERRPVTELALPAAPVGLALGALAGAGLIAAVVGVLWLLGMFYVTDTRGPAVLLPVFALSAQSGYFEEVIARGILFRITEEGLGTWAALAFSALLFGFLHGLNPNATLMSSVSIAASAGVLLAAVYALTRSLWAPIGLHFAWNFTEGGIFGIPVSGFSIEGLLAPKIEGPALLTGGAFGIEASVLVPVLGLAAGAACLVAAARRRRLVPPAWHRY
jgi:CAAX protease family protein